jgi:secreted PhoX family phosphatase
MALSRRQFFALSGASAAGTFLAGAPFKKLYAREFLGQATKAEGFGSLQRDPNGIFDLPPGFQYRAFSRTGETMTDGNIVPSLTMAWHLSMGVEEKLFSFAITNWILTNRLIMVLNLSSIQELQEEL